MEYTFLFRVRPLGTPGAYAERLTVTIAAEPHEWIGNVVGRAAAQLRVEHPEFEPGGVAMASADGSFLRPALGE